MRTNLVKKKGTKSPLNASGDIEMTAVYAAYSKEVIS